MNDLFTEYGIRGNIDGNLDMRSSYRLGKALGHYLDGNVAFMTDGRPTSNAVGMSVASGLMAMGCDVHEMESFPSEVFQLYVRDREEVSGGIIISDPDGNGRIAITSIFSDGEEMVTGAMDKIESYYDEDVEALSMNEVGRRRSCEEPLTHYISKVLAGTDVKSLRDAKIKVVIDCCNSVSSVALPRMISEMGLEMISLNTSVSERKSPEDRIEDIRRLVDSNNCSIGVIADDEKIRVVTNEGEAMTDDDLFAIIAKRVLTKAPGAIVATATSSMTVDHVVDNYGGRIARSKVGQMSIIDRMKDTKSFLGGEDGRFVFSDHQYCYDMGYALKTVLECIVRFGPLHNQLSMLNENRKEREEFSCPENLKHSAVEMLHEIHAVTAKDVDDNLYLEFPEGTIRVIYRAKENNISLICEPGKSDDWKGRMEDVKEELTKFITF